MTCTSPTDGLLSYGIHTSGYIRHCSCSSTRMDEVPADQRSIEAFFSDCGPAIDAGFAHKLQTFIKRHTGSNGQLTRPIACVTSGGTTVPLERNCVRFIDNFSAGTRGAMSTEQFLQVGAHLQLHQQISTLRNCSIHNYSPCSRRLATL